MLRTPQRYWHDTYAGVPYQRGAGFRLNSLLGPIINKAIPFLQTHLLPKAAGHSFKLFMDLLDGKPFLSAIDDHVINPLVNMVGKRSHQAGFGFDMGPNVRKRSQNQHGGSMLPFGDDASFDVHLRTTNAKKKRSRAQRSKQSLNRRRKPRKQSMKGPRKSRKQSKKTKKTSKRPKRPNKRLANLLVNL